MARRNARDDVLRRMLKTPPAPHKPKGKPFPQTPEELAEEMKKNPNLLEDLARDLGQSDPDSTS